MSNDIKDRELLEPGSIELEIIDILQSNYAPRILKDRLSNYHENDIASALEFLNRDERTRLYSLLDSDTLIDVLEYLEDRNDYIKEFNPQKRTAILERLETNILADYLAYLSKDERNYQLALLNDETRKEVMLVTSFNEDEIGSRMSTSFIKIDEGINVREAMRELMKQAEESDNISTLYVTDNNDVLIGAIDLKDLIIARANDDIDSITMTSYPYVYSDEEIEDCIDRITEYLEDSIPILDADNKLKGVLTSQDIVTIIDEQFGEDYARLAGLSSEEDLNEPISQSVSKRWPWLGALMVLGFIVSYVVGLFEDVVAQVAIIVTFQSLILDMAGNVGTQSLAITIRVLMDESVDFKEKLYLIFKEVRVGLALGCALGICAAIIIFLYLTWAQHELLKIAVSVSVCASLALLISVIVSSFTGTVVPITLKQLGYDPAVASGPFITTMNDLTAVIIYYGLCWFILIHTLHL